MRASFSQDQLPRFSAIDSARIEPTLRALLTKFRQRIDELLQQKTYTWHNLMQPLEIMFEELNHFWSPIAHLHSVQETESLREAYNKSLPLITEFHTELSQNEKFFEAVQAIAESPDFASLNSAQRKIIENDLRDFKLSGVHLPTDKKTQMAALQKRLTELMTKFSENLLDATQAWHVQITDPQKLEGLPKQAIQLAKDTAKHKGLEGFVFTLDYPSYSTALRFLSNRDLRKTLYEAYTTRASDRGPNANTWDNSPVMNEILKIRHDIATLVGFANYADYSLAAKMAKEPDEVLNFLMDLVRRSKSFAEKEYQEITELATSLDGIRHLESWDISYYSEKLRQSKFNFSQEDLRPYFPSHRVIEGLFTLVNKIYGLTIQEEKGFDVWHPDVQFFCIYDDDGKLRGGIYMDLYARPQKREGAWMDECRTRFRNDQHVQHPVAFLTCNFMRAVDNEPALLTHEDVTTLFHEFGHCLHHILTKVDYPSVAGINGVFWDAVEFPSQFMEYFCLEQQCLQLIASHYQTKAPFPEELYKKMLAAKYFLTGLHMLRQLEFALFDFRMHMEFDPTKENQIQSLLNEIRKEVSVISVPEFNRFQHSFAHIFAGSYAAGYYSYKWAEVLSADSYEKFEENGIFDRGTGQSFMENILEVGGVRDPLSAFVAFRGREPKIDALLRQNGI